MAAHAGELAVITGASTGIGYELAKIAAQEANLAERGWPDAYDFGRVHSPRA